MAEDLYNVIGTDYNSTRQADPYIVSRLLHFLKPEPGKTYLDIGCGTGNYTIALADKGIYFIGIEPSEEMLKEARRRCDTITWKRGTAEQIPAADNSFDGVIATLTIHHWKDINRALKEIGRVLNANGRIVFFTADPEQIKAYWLNYYFPLMIRSSIEQMPSLNSINAALKNNHFEIISTEKYFINDDLQDNFLYSGKNKPQLYLNEQIRNGISSFAALANKAEVDKGLSMLQSDIESGRFETIQKEYENELGDYLFITAQKVS